MQDLTPAFPGISYPDFYHSTKNNIKHGCQNGRRNQGIDQRDGWNEINHKVRHNNAQANCYQGDYEYNQ